MKTDNRMVRCVLASYVTCAAKVPEACICYQMQQCYDPDHGNMYEQRYRAKYGKDDDVTR